MATTSSGPAAKPPAHWPIAVNRNATAFLYYTLMFLMFAAIYMMSSLFRVLHFVLQRWRVLLR